LQKQHTLLEAMAKKGLISQAQSDEAKQEQVILSSTNSKLKAPHFTQYVLGELKKINIPVKQGLNIYTTLDYPLYQLAIRISQDRIHNISEYNNVSNAAMVMIDNQTGKLIVMMGG